MEVSKKAKLLWTPSSALQVNSNIQHFMDWLASNKQLRFTDYQQLWKWSIEDVSIFWEFTAEYFEIIWHQPYRTILSGKEMPGMQWFSGGTLNYAEHIYRKIQKDNVLITYIQESNEPIHITGKEFLQRVHTVQQIFIQHGLVAGDRVVAYVPNCPQASITWFAACALGLVWSSCSPDFGGGSAVERFAQIEPKAILTVNGYVYQGKQHERLEEVQTILEHLPSVSLLLSIDYLDNQKRPITKSSSHIYWEDISIHHQNDIPIFIPVAFSHPLWILYSSGTTGLPKPIVHSHGGNLLEHLKYLNFHNDVKPGECFFWFTTTGWMMWNFLHSSMLCGARILLYDGHPAYPSIQRLWEIAAQEKIHHFGTSAPFLISCMKNEIIPKDVFNLSDLRSIGSTGSPLPPEAFDYVYASISSEVWLCSMSGGTDVCTAFVGGCPVLPVYEGEIQCRALGVALFAWNDQNEEVIETMGEMVITKPMPSMPVFFWNDAGNVKYHTAYFEEIPGVWKHGDFIEITKQQGVIIYGRSDATLNRHGIRIGTSEIYRVLDHLSWIQDSLIINVEMEGGKHFMPLFVVLKGDSEISDTKKQEINQALKQECSPRHVPDTIIQVKDLPYTISGKKLESPIKKLMLGIPLDKAVKSASLRNPDALEFFIEYAKAFRKQI